MERWRKIFAVAVIGLFFVAIFVPFAASFFLTDKTLSLSEKRKLAQFPKPPAELSQLPVFVKRLEQYYNDQFGFRSFFIEGYSRVKHFLGDEDIASSVENVGTKNIISGRQGWSFLNRRWDGDPFSDYRNIDLYSEGELLRATLLFAAQADWLNDRGVEYLFFFAPNKHTIYSEYLPEYIVKEGEFSSFDQLKDALGRYTSVRLVDLRKPLIEAKSVAASYWKDHKDEASLYYKKDSHWNGAGADIAQYMVALELEKIFPGKIKPYKRSYEDFVMMSFAGDITLIQGRKDKEAYGPVLLKGLCTKETKSDYLQRSHETHCPQAELNGLIFYDSFMPPLKPYFADYFKRAVFRWQRLDLGEVQKQLKGDGLDVVIEERAERHLPFTPATDGTGYGRFWNGHWNSWKKWVFFLEGEDELGGNIRLVNVTERPNEETEGVVLSASSNDPAMYLPQLEVRSDALYLARIVIESPRKTTLQLYYGSRQRKSFPHEHDSVSIRLRRGKNLLYLPLFDLDLTGDFRLDPARHPGEYVLHSLEIKELDWIDLR